MSYRTESKNVMKVNCTIEVEVLLRGVWSHPSEIHLHREGISFYSNFQPLRSYRAIHLRHIGKVDTREMGLAIKGEKMEESQRGFTGLLIHQYM